MKLILTQEIDRLGEAGDAVEVKDGYGRNYLIPQGKAVMATAGAEKQVANIKAAQQVRAARDLDHAAELAAAIAAVQVRLQARAGKAGRLFGSITGADVVDAVKAAGGPALDKRTVVFEGQIRSTGKHKVSVRLHPEVLSTFQVDVVPDKKSK